ncbi:hypothetical protein ACFX11_007474 [Malus domestica]
MDTPNVKGSCYEKRFLPATMYGRYSFINVIGGQAEKEGDKHNRKNIVEVAIVRKILRYLFKVELHEVILKVYILLPHYKHFVYTYMQNGYVRKKKLCIGVMSPYAGQVVVIRDKIGNRYDKLDGFIVKVKIVDDYQGGEEDNVLWILVSSSFHKHVNVLAEAFEKIDNTYSDCELWG